METTLLINYDDILFYTTISGNIDPYKINPHIHNAEILYLEPILGSDLYNKLVDMVSDGSITGSTEYNTLLTQYITPSVAFHTVELFIPLNAYEISDGGMYKHISTNAESSPMAEIDRIANKYRIIGDKYDSLLVKYLCKNADSYTEYTNNTGLTPKTEHSGPHIGIYTGIRNSGSKIRI